MATEDLRFRAATVSDLDRILEIHITAFPDPRGVEERRRVFTASRWGTLEDLILAVRGDDILGQAFLFPLEAWFGGCAVQIGAVASLAVAPEARCQGIATALLGALHVASDMRGDALTMLYAFRQRFYAKVGYGPTASRRRLEIDPASVPTSWLALARARVRRARGEDKEAIRSAYARAAARASGWLTRDENAWDRHLASERRQFLVADRPPREGGGMAGYVAFRIFQDEPHAATTLNVDEIAADDDVTRLALIGALAATRDQVTGIELEVDAGDPLELGLIDPDARRFGTRVVEHDLGTIVGGPMVRIEDVPRAIEARGYPTDGAFDLVVHTGQRDRNGAGDELAVSVRVADGHAEVSAARGAAGAIRTTRATLASLLYGGLRPSDAVRIGLADADARTLARVDAILAMPSPTTVDPF
jgi:predicted acetyltransferase